MIKVCHVISGDLWAGAEVMAYNLIKGLRDYPGLSILTVILNEAKLAARIRDLRVPIHVLDESKLSFFHTLTALRKIINRFKPDIVHSHRYKEHLLAYLASKPFGHKILIGTQHGMPETYDDPGGLRYRTKSKLNFHILSRRFDCTVVVSDDMKYSFMERYGFSQNRLQVIHNGMEIPPRLSARTLTRSFTIGSCGRLFPVKDYTLMVEAAHIISRETNGIRFVLAGDGPERAPIQERISRYGLKATFKLQGFVDNMEDFYRGIDLYMNTSLHEGIPMSILEAMGHQVPVVAPRVGGIKEIVRDGVDGYLIRTRNPADFAEASLQLYRNESSRRVMSLSARKRVEEEFSMERMAERYYHLYLDYSRNTAKVVGAA